MGIDIKDKCIIYNASHDKLLGTSIPKRLIFTRLEKVSIFFIFRRVKNRENDQKGDSNPAIFALKNMRGFSISDEEKRNFFPSFFRILKPILYDKNFDLILVIPSSHQIVKIFASRVSKILEDVKIDDTFFEKFKNSDILSIKLIDIPSKDRHAISRIHKKIKKMPLDNEFSMKEIENKYRKYFSPLKISPKNNNEVIHAKNILIIDDLYATGTSMKNAISIIRGINKDVHIEGLCLFSRLNK